MQPVRIPKIWQDYPVVCIASGPSLTDADCAYIYNMRRDDKCRVIVVNNNYIKAPWADHLHFCDRQFYEWHCRNAVFKSTRMTMTTLSNEFTQDMIDRGVGLLLMGQNGGLVLDSDNTIATGGNSGYQAVNIAALYGSRKIILLGYDCKASGERVHWFGNHPAPTCPSVFKDQLKWWRTMPEALNGIEVLNATRDTALDMFPQVELTEVLR